MATRALTTAAPSRAIHIPETHTTAAHPANDNTPSRWIDDPRAKLLLASCVANPPKGQWKRDQWARSNDQWFAYVGYRAEALDAIRMAHGQRVLLAYHAIGDAAYPAFEAWCGEPDVTTAIDAALNTVREG